MIDHDSWQSIYSGVAFIWEACDGKLFKSTIAVELKVLKTTKLEKFEVTHGMPLIPV